MTSYILPKTLAMPTELYVFRHGQPQSFPGRVLPIKSAALSALGLAQAFAKGRLMAEQGMLPTVILSSPLKRAWQTAQAFNEGFASVSGSLIPLKQLDCLQEINIGSNPLVTSAFRVFPVISKLLQKLGISARHETLSEVMQRIKHEFVSELLLHTGTVVVIGHQVSNSCLVSVLVEKKWKLTWIFRPHVDGFHVSFNTNNASWSLDKKNIKKIFEFNSDIPRK